jgi:hypothetical protein
VSLIAPKYQGDREKGASALKEWYASVVSGLPPEFVMGDAFKFWQPRFDAEFATTPDPMNRPAFKEPTQADIEAQLEILHKHRR